MHSPSHVPCSIQQACEALMFSWAQAQDTKDTKRMLSVFAPTITTDYRSVGMNLSTDVPAQQHVDSVLNPMLMGRADLRTQHLIGAQSWSRISDHKVKCEFQVRASVVRVTHESGAQPMGITGPKAIPHGWNEMVFELVDGEWKITFVAFHLEWLEGDWDAVINGPSTGDAKA